MKPYEELTLKEKQELLREWIRKWKTNSNGYGCLKTIEQVALICVSDYIYNYRKYINKCIKTPTRRQDKDMLNILKLLPEYLINKEHSKN